MARAQTGDKPRGLTQQEGTRPVRRRLFDLYHRRLARLAACLPEGLRAELSGVLYQITRHPDFGFVHARALMRRGRGRRAARLYGALPEDPLFAARLEPCAARPGVSMGAPAPGSFQAQIGYLGLRLSGEVRHAGPGAAPEHLLLELDGVPLRRETLRFREGIARFRWRIARPVLAQFPARAVLSARVGDAVLPAPGGGRGWQLALPHGAGGVSAQIARRGLLEKKGHLRLAPGEIAARQDAYLALYAELRAVFAREFDLPLVILYGTLLGQVRGGDFIPGDDDFDVGYPSRASAPAAVRAEAVRIMCRLADLGYVIVLNEFGRPFRVRAPGGDAWCHLDNRPVFAAEEGHVWLHKHARLPLPLSDFEQPETARLRDTEVLRPARPAAFLAAYYGPDWRVPDPGYSNTGRALPRAAARGLAQLCLGADEQRALAARYPGRIVPVRWQPLYPLQDYAARVGF